ncbi:MAG: Glycosyl hydrolases family 2, sugar binding domain [bacterium ADurb.Bin478]|nr:MAG: Glycosyl hydrolases family 2, sugar binding domain [bacterium ADurb.Bin478]
MRTAVLQIALTGILLMMTQSNALTLPAIFSDHMVLQQKCAASFWGLAAPGEQVTVSADWGKFLQTQADPQGRWLLRLPTPHAGGPYRITVRAGQEEKVFSDVLIGEVWLCSGQSNMEMPLMGWPPHDLIEGSEQAIRNAHLPMIRLFTVAHAVSDVPLSDCSGTWSPCTPETAATFSATAFFFGRTLNEKLNIPIGLIHSSWGGTPAQSWTSAEFLQTMPDFKPIVEKIEQSRGTIERYQQWLTQFPTLNVSDRTEETRWLNLDFNDAACCRPDFSDSEWRTMNLPVYWEQTELGEFDGAVWFRKTIDIPAEWTGEDAVLELGPIDDMDRTFFNGELVGSHEKVGFWQTPRTYTIPASLLRKGQNVIAVRCVDNLGGGGIFGKPEQLRLYLPSAPAKSLSLAGEWKYLTVAEFRSGIFYVFPLTGNTFQTHPKVPVQISPYTSTFLYNAMIAPLIPYAIKGAIWYQGEANTGNPRQYRNLFPLMIRNWRQDWGQGDFPFYYVQIAPWEYGDATRSQELRDVQRQCLDVPNSGMAVTLDIGHPQNIHPGNKLDVGKRLALWALAKDYKKKVTYSGPLYQRIRIQGDQIKVYFDHCGTGLAAGPSGLHHFEIAGADHRFYPAQASLSKNQVIVKAVKVKQPVAVRYAWSNTADASLFNKEGLPASSFRSDDWPE